MEQIFIYVDETGNPNIANHDGNEQFFGVGVAIMTTEPTQKLITQAIDNLKLEIDNLQKSDLKTLERGYFHACKDGPISKSKLLEVVNQLNIKFDYLTFNKKSYSDSKPISLNTERTLHQHMVTLASLVSTMSRVKNIYLIVAQRQKSFPEGCENVWIGDFYDALVYSSSENPAMPTIFPNIKVKIVDGKVPGIQISDFLLWVFDRKYHKNDPKWFDRFKSSSSAETSIPNDPLYMADININKGLSGIEYESSYEPTAQEIDQAEEKLSDNKLAELFLWIEDTVGRFINNASGELSYLLPHLQKAAIVLRKSENINTKDIKEICKAFIVIFDTSKIYKDFSHDDLVFALLAKRYVSIILAGQKVQWLRLASFWIELHRLKIVHQQKLDD